MKKTNKQQFTELKEKYDNLVKWGKAVIDRPKRNYYHYETQPPKEKTGTVNMVKVEELFAHVQTANNLGYDTMLTAENGAVRVLFVAKMPSYPVELY